MSTKSPEVALAIVAGVCAVIGLGQLLVSKEKITLRKAVGRAVCAAGIGIFASFLFFVVPFTSALPPEWALAVQVSLGAGLASFGTSGLERLAGSWGAR